MRPLLLFLLSPIAIGIACERLCANVRLAAASAALATLLLLGGTLVGLDPDGRWSWLATLLVAPLPIAAALGAVMLCAGRDRAPRRVR